MMLVRWFSPLPPARTDIANYSVSLAPFLGQHLALEMMAPDRLPPVQITAKRISTLSPRTANGTGISIYNIGNDARYHDQILALALTSPGVVVLHDRVINELVIGSLNSETGKTDLIKLMATWYGLPGRECAREMEAGQIQPSEVGAAYPLFEHVIERALGVVTHNSLVAAELRQTFPGLPVLDLPLPYAGARLTHLRQPSATVTLKRLVMFGFMASNRRATEFLEVWARSPFRQSFTLDLAGELADRSRFDATANALGLASQITHHGYLDDTALDSLIACSDLAINLRNPSMGEASGSQLRIWANGCPSMVSNTGWYSTLPDDAVIKIGLASEIEDIDAVLTKLATDNLPGPALATAGLNCLTRHDPAQYAQSLCDWLLRHETDMRRNWVRARLIDACARGLAQAIRPGQANPRMPADFP